ncbi:FadR/GntR family transcriptional regulator (plasmid) [Microvirga lotononidis]|nr:FadR/GntR family transcriptional regulator [Microvirga lotononidis]WQO30532.1 FadR/GntR family transcriptional regulator [Microvirga lotononidis]
MYSNRQTSICEENPEKVLGSVRTVNTLTARTIQALKARIASGSLKPGDKLPTLNELGAELGVSRTVIREAVAVLRSDGLLKAQHGVGVFVCELQEPTKAEEAASFLTPLADIQTSFMDLLELRMAFEVHAAGLAATRHSWAQEAKIWDALKQFEASLEDEELLDQLDFVFHRSIAEATNNGAFIEFFSVMSLKIMPQPAFSRAMNPALITSDYIRHTLVEHRAICEAISAGDAEQAREAMRAHLARSHRRYRGFADSTQSPLSNIASDA